MKYLLSSGIGYRTHTLREIEELARNEGFDGLELNLPPRHLPADESKRDTDYTSVTTIKAIHAPGDVYDYTRFTSALQDTLKLAEQLNAPLINIHPATLSEGGRENVVQGIKAIKEAEETTTITIAYEILVNPYGLEEDRQQYFLQQQAYDSPQDYVADVKKYDLTATLDAAHLGAWGIPSHEFIAALGENLKHVHLSDYSKQQKREHLLLGEGDLDLITFLKELEQRVQETIHVTVELHPLATREEVVQAIRKSAQYINKHTATA